MNGSGLRRGSLIELGKAPDTVELAVALERNNTEIQS